MSLNSVSRLFPVTEEDEEEQLADLQTTSRVALDLFGESDSESDHGHGYVQGYGEHYGYVPEEFDGMTPSIRLVEDAENGLLMPLPLPLTPTPPTSPTAQSFASSDSTSLSPPPRRERKRSMMNRPTLPVLDVEMNLRQDPDLPVPTPVPSQFDSRAFPPTQYQHGHPLVQTSARYQFDPQTKVEIFDISYDEDLESTYPSYRTYPSIAETEEPEEFTLAMDVSPLRSRPSHSRHMSLPLPVTACTGGKRFDHDEWIVDGVDGVEVEVEVGVRYR